MKLRLILLSGLILLIAAAGCGPREKTVASVGREKITVQEYKDEFLKRYRSEENAIRQPYQMREKVLREMATNLALYQDAVARGFDKKPQVVEQMEQLARRKALDLLYQQEIIDKVINDEAAKKFYDMSGEEVKARHILLKVSEMDTLRRDTAKVLARVDSIRKAIDGGLDFKKAAAMFSEDATSATDSGDIGWFGWGRMVDEFQQAAWKAQVGKPTNPVRTPYGYHLILVEQKRPVENRQPFEQMKESIKMQLREVESVKLNETARMYVENLRKSAKLEYNEANMETFRKRVMDPTVSQAQELGPMFTNDQKALVAATYKGGKATLDDLIQKLGANAARVNWTEKQSVIDLANAIVEPKLLDKDAESKGLFKKALKSPEAAAEKQRAVTALLEKEEITDKVQPTEADERRYYDSHLNNFIQPEMRTVREIFFKEDSAKAAQVRSRALKGEDFKKLALKFNEKETTKADTGKLGPFEQRLFGLIGKTAFSLQKVGDVSDILLVGKSFSVIQLLDIIPSRTKTFEEAQADVKKQTRQSMTEDRRNQLQDTALKKFKLQFDEKELRAVWPLADDQKKEKIAREP